MAAMANMDHLTSKSHPIYPSSLSERNEASSEQHKGSSKPNIILVSPSKTDTAAFTARYHSILTKMKRDARLVFALGLAGLQSILADEEKADSIAGFVVTDASIMNVDDDKGEGGMMRALSKSLSGIVAGEYSYSYFYEQSNTNAITDEGWKTRLRKRSVETTERTRIRPREWTVVFAFDFPSQAALQPLRFRRYMTETFGAELGWKICGTTKAKWMLQINKKGLKKMSERVYRGNRYELRAVFLAGVEKTDKILIVGKGKAANNGNIVPETDVARMLGQPQKLYADRLGDMSAPVSKDETDSTAGEEEVVVMGDGSSRTAAAEAASTIRRRSLGQAKHLNMAVRDSPQEKQELSDHEFITEIGDPYEGEDEKEGEPAKTDDSDSNTEEQIRQGRIYVNMSQMRRKRDKPDDISDSDSDADSLADEEAYLPKKQKSDAFIADCPVALHEIKSWVESGGEQFRVRGYVGFVGHVEDNRSMASLILGMCGVQKARRLP